VAERLMATLLKSVESKDFVGSNPTLSANEIEVPNAPSAAGPVLACGPTARSVRHLSALTGDRDGARLYLPVMRTLCD
jgi:hypothetical protein